MWKRTLSFVVAAVVIPAGVSSASYIELSLQQRTIGTNPSVQYFGEINVDVSGISNVSSVDMATSDTSSFSEWNPIQFDGSTAYYAKSQTWTSAADLMANDIASNFGIRINYADSTSSVYFFTLNKANITKSQFAGLPTITAPIDGQTGVAADATIMWTAPANATDSIIIADRRPVSTDNDSSEILADGATTWTPGNIAADGERFRISYGKRDTSGTASSLSLLSGSTIDWGNSPFSTANDGTPLLAYVSSNEVTVNSVPEPASLGILGTAGLLLLRRKRIACPR